jgi:hypothetical protein
VTALCATRDPEWWAPESDGARLALLFCAVCPGCPDNDPEPCGVIRQGVAYSDSGKPLPICEDCGYPVADYRGGHVRCPRCSVPDVWIPSKAWLTRRRVLALPGLPAREVAERVGISPNSVWRIRGEEAAKGAAA